MLIRSLQGSLIILLTIITFGCQKDDPTSKDHENPALTFVQEDQAKNNLTGTVDLTFDLKDNLSVARIEVFVDGTLITDDKLSKANETYNFKWDSKSVADGPHTLKVIVTDENGNTTEKSFDLIVKNILLTITIPSNYLGTGTHWIFLSDHDGNLLGAQKATDNSKLIFPFTDGFDDETLMVHFFSYQTLPNEPKTIIRNILTFTDVAVRDLVLPNAVPTTTTDHGMLKFEISDMTPGCTVTASGPNILYNAGSYNGESLYVAEPHLINDQATDVMLTFYQPDGSAKYKFFKDVKPNDEITASFSDFTDMTKVEVPIEDSYMWELNVGYPSGEAPFGQGFLYFNSTTQEIQNSIPTYYPENGLFKKYISVANLWTGNGTNYYYVTRNESLPTVYKKLEVDLNSHDFSDNKIQMNFSGDADVLTLSYDNSTSVDTANIFDSWSVRMKFQSAINFKLPVLPTQITDLYFPDGIKAYDFNSLAIDKSAPSSPYDNVLKSIFYGEDQEPSADNYEYFTKVISLTIPSGRKETSQSSQKNNNLDFFWHLPANDREIIKKEFQRRHQ
jgi:hypothetical protein